MAASRSLASLVRDERFVFLAMAALIAVAPFVAYPFFVMQVLCFGLFACAFNLLLGYGGLLSFGHAAFFGLASYVGAHAAKVWGLTPELAILSGAGVAALLGLVIGALAIRRQGIYFAMITLGLAQMVQFYATQADFTGGEDGIQGVPRGKLFGAIDLSDDRVLYVVVAVIVLAGLFALHRIVHSPFGQVMKAIRDNEPRSLSLGYDAERFKLLMFVLSATLAGVAGATKALVVRIASLTDVHWTMSGLVVLMALVGGTGTLFGPMLGALVVVTMEHYLAPLGSWVTVTQGAVFVICVLAFRDGIAGTLGKVLRKAG